MRVHRLPIAVSIFVLIVLAAFGCGGGGHGGKKTGGGPVVVDPISSNFRLAITWPDRTRAITGVASANSAKIIVERGSTQSTITVNRPAGTEESTQTYTATTSLLTGAVTVHVRFYSDADGMGTMVGRADVAGDLEADGSVTSPDGSPLGEVTLETTVKVVEIAHGQTLQIGETKELVATALDALGHVVAVEPGAFAFRVGEGASHLSVTSAGVATATSAGDAYVVATVDGIQSADTLVSVVPIPTASYHLQIVWPERTRAVHGLNSAQSVRLTLSGLGDPIVTTADRPEGLDVQIQEVVAPLATTLGAGTLNVQFFSEFGGDGVVVGNATVAVALQEGGELTSEDGSPLPEIYVDATVKSLAVAPVAAMLPNETLTLTAMAYDAESHVVPVSVGSFRFSLVSGEEFLSVTPDGIATARAAGDATVSVSADGVTSPALTITVGQPDTGGVFGYRVVDVAARDLAYSSSLRRLLASVGNDGGTHANQIVSMDPVDGSIKAFQSVAKDPGKLALSDDGRSLFIGSDGTGDVERMFLPAMNYYTFALESTNSNLQVEDMEVLPGTVDSVIITRKDPRFSPRGNGVAVYDLGIRRPSVYAESGGANVVEVNPTGDEAYTYTREVTSFGLARLEIKPDGVHAVEEAEGVLGGFGKDIRYSQGQLFTTGMETVGLHPFTWIGEFPERKFETVILPDPVTPLVYAITWDSPDRYVRVYDRNTGLKVSETILPNLEGGITSFVKVGSDDFAFSTTVGKVVFIDNLPLTPSPAARRAPRRRGK